MSENQMTSISIIPSDKNKIKYLVLLIFGPNSQELPNIVSPPRELSDQSSVHFIL